MRVRALFGRIVDRLLEVALVDVDPFALDGCFYNHTIFRAALAPALPERQLTTLAVSSLTFAPTIPSSILSLDASNVLNNFTLLCLSPSTLPMQCTTFHWWSFSYFACIDSIEKILHLPAPKSRQVQHICWRQMCASVVRLGGFVCLNLWSIRSSKSHRSLRLGHPSQRQSLVSIRCRLEVHMRLKMATKNENGFHCFSSQTRDSTRREKHWTPPQLGTA